MTKKKIIAVAMAMALALGVTACGGSGSNTSDTSAATPNSEATGDEVKHEPTTIRFYNYALSETEKADWWNKTIEGFEKENDWVTVEPIAVDYNSMVSTFTNDIASGQSVDLVYGEASWVPSLADAGFIQEPSNVLDADFYDGYYDYVLDQLKYDGKVYAVPQYYSNSLIFVNKDLVEKAGLKMEDFPTDLDGLKSWIEQLSAYYKGDNSISTIFGLTSAEVSATGANINAMYTAFGGQLINEDGTLADLNTEQNKTALNEAFDFYKYLISNGYTQENQKLKDYRAAFGAGNVCMYVDNSWGYSLINSTSEGAASNFTVTASIPTKMGTYGEGKTLVETHCFLIGSDLTDDQKAATNAFIQYITNDDTMKDYLNDIGIAFPAHECMADFKVSPILEGASSGVDNVVCQTQIPAMVSVQTQLATSVLNYSVKGDDFDTVLKDYIEQANYYINQ